jgi:hypothetical protein
VSGRVHARAARRTRQPLRNRRTLRNTIRCDFVFWFFLFLLFIKFIYFILFYLFYFYYLSFFFTAISNFRDWVIIFLCFPSHS